MPERDNISWTAMIKGRHRMVHPSSSNPRFAAADEFSMVSSLTTCEHLGALELGEWIKAYTGKHKIKVDIHLVNVDIDMYFKCGNVEKALMIFSRMPCRDKFTWTAMIIGLATNGNEIEARYVL
ncbi:putative pentatricopeptide repeat-containing protein [Capsicum baccatum]|uniref:Pentatricopeptide repeat-containing protein n=1 Tax=Capsicum baccatum TaxID=33114 RepID=A0A2G2WCH1_CAPBA|nr:putative pentatricopeptide repeat-containing protein [Capsicum baccatum]